MAVVFKPLILTEPLWLHFNYHGILWSNIFAFAYENEKEICET